jgi:hypothetical protein
LGWGTIAAGDLQSPVEKARPEVSSQEPSLIYNHETPSRSENSNHLPLSPGVEDERGGESRNQGIENFILEGHILGPSPAEERFYPFSFGDPQHGGGEFHPVADITLAPHLREQVACAKADL